MIKVLSFMNMKKMKYIMVISFMSMMSIVSAQTRDTVPQINKKVNPKIERNSIRKGNGDVS